MKKEGSIKQEEEIKRVIVRGYMRPDKTSYYVSIPKEIREVFDLKGGEYFVMRANKERQKISLMLVEFAPDE